MTVMLEPLAVEHADELFDALQDLRLYTYIPREPPPNVHALRERYHFTADPSAPPDDERWLNWVMRNLEGVPVGLLEATVRTQHAAIAYSVFPPFWRQGIAKAGCSAMLSLLAEQYVVKKARAWVDTRNVASIRLLESLGFARLATHLAADEFKGSVSDEYEYALTLR